MINALAEVYLFTGDQEKGIETLYQSVETDSESVRFIVHAASYLVPRIAGPITFRLFAEVIEVKKTAFSFPILRSGPESIMFVKKVQVPAGGP